MNASTFLFRRLLGLAMLCLAATGVWAAANKSTCIGKFANPITDICWSCGLPVSIGSATVGDLDNQDDIANPSNPVCSCKVKPTVGVTLGFWEPAARIEVVRSPFCLVSMGGVDGDPGIPAPRHGRGNSDLKSSFYQVHYYKDPVLYWLEVIGDFPCIEKGTFDIAYLTEADPLWADDMLNLLLNPDALLFANPIAVAACAADCVKASVGFGFKEMFWCSGCQGTIYPLNGWSASGGGGVRNAALLSHKILAKLHRQLIAWGWHGKDGLCGPYFMPAMDKTAYKTQLIYPVPNTKKIMGKCCQPLGRTTVLWGSMREIPARGEDFAFEVFRKRNCCMGF